MCDKKRRNVRQYIAHVFTVRRIIVHYTHAGVALGQSHACLFYILFIYAPFRLRDNYVNKRREMAFTFTANDVCFCSHCTDSLGSRDIVFRSCSNLQYQRVKCLPFDFDYDAEIK